MVKKIEEIFCFLFLIQYSDVNRYQFYVILREQERNGNGAGTK